MGNTKRFSGAKRRSLYLGVLAVIVILAGVQWFRPLPSPHFRSALAASLRLPGQLPSLPWPSAGSATLVEVGAGSLGMAGSSQPAPIASITKVMTAYVVLEDHPLAPGVAGPDIAVTQDVIDAYHQGVASGQSVVAVAAGESLTEQQALQGLLVASGNNLATLLADWDAGNITSFVAKMNAAARDMGLDSTHFNDPSGFDPGSVSTVSDVVHLGETAMTVPALAAVVAMSQVTLPVAGLVYNFDYDLGHDGITGIKTGTDSAAGGCFLFEAQKTVDGKTVTLIGAVLGQRGSSLLEAALKSADALVKAAFGSVAAVPLVSAGKSLGRVADAWGGSVPVTLSGTPIIAGWPGISVPVELHEGPLAPTMAIGARVGALSAGTGDQKIDAVMRTSQQLSGPSVLWRLTRW